MAKRSGTVKHWNPSRGFGFIVPDDGGPDIFVHVSATSDAGMAEPEPGQRLTFDVKPGRDGRPVATKLEAVP